MTQKQIQVAAKEYADIVSKNDTYCAIDFEAGANWRMNSVWHDAIEQPRDRTLLLTLCKGNMSLICGPNNTDWDETVRIFEVERWAYIKDLLPTEE